MIPYRYHPQNLKTCPVYVITTRVRAFELEVSDTTVAVTCIVIIILIHFLGFCFFT